MIIPFRNSLVSKFPGIPRFSTVVNGINLYLTTLYIHHALIGTSIIHDLYIVLVLVLANPPIYE